MSIPTIQWIKGSVKIIDQTKLPGKIEFIYCRSLESIWQAIKRLRVRGAPALGAAAGFGVLLGLKTFKGKNRKAFDRHVEKACCYIATSRPTAVNLFNALNRMRQVVYDNPSCSVERLKKRLTQEALDIFNEDKKVCRSIGRYGEKFVKSGNNILTICNAGGLATVDYGTALGVIYCAKKKKKMFKVFSCETRPLLQGARLTTWELLREKIDTTLICDNMAATLMKQNQIDMVITGADRIAANGDTANKIGTFSLAVLAKYHRIPFYVAAPFSTFDLNMPNGAKIPIEQRDREEVVRMAGKVIAPKNVKVFNPAFDVTDHFLITAIITEFGVITPPFKANIKKLFKKHAIKS